MNKLLAVCLSILTMSSIYGQEGSLYIGGMAGFASQKSTDAAGNDFKSSQWNFSPEIGTWTSDQLQLGLSLSISGSDNDNEEKTSVFAPGLYLRKWKPLGDKFSIFGGINASYSSSKTESRDSSVELRGFNTFLDFGAALALGERWNIVGRYASLGYGVEKNIDTELKTTTFGLDVNTLGNPFNIGIYYTLRQ